MPLVEYYCEECDYTYEILWKKLDYPDEIPCPVHRESLIKKKFSTLSWSFSPFLRELGEGNML